MLRDSTFTSVVRATLVTTPVTERLRHRAAVALERIARGGGATNWYYCRNAADLTSIEERLRPGSVVSFYFDDRIRYLECSPELATSLEEDITKNREIVAGVLSTDGIQIDLAIVVSIDDFKEFLSEISPPSKIFCGLFPGRDNDGVRAITVYLPDNDGVLRPHAH